MSNSSLAFAFDPPSPPLVVTAAKAMALQLAAGSALSRSDINRIMTEHFGGTDALGTEAMLDRRLADLSDEEREALEIDLSPREYV